MYIEKIRPETRAELVILIEETIERYGNKCDLNFIDTSLITNMSWLFNIWREFNGDISKWNVSNVTDMFGMFYDSDFNGDISKWDTSNVTEMTYMFKESDFNGDISKWNVGNVIYMSYMFAHSKFNGDISKWNLSNVIDKESIFS